MKSLGTSIEEAKFSISGGRVKVELGQASATVPVQQLGDLIRTLEGIRFILDGPTSATPSVVVAPHRAAEPAAVAASAEPADKGNRRKRRSRKRVGDALEKWMQENPGWHTEEQLLRAVKQNNMSDADPKRALKIALGKQANDLFLKDNAGRWKLKSDPTEASTAPPAKGPRKATPAKAKATAPAATRATRKRRVETKGESDTAAPEEEDGPAAEAEGTTRSAVLVKRGQNRKAVTLAPGEVEARRQATEAIEGRRKTRWSRVSTNELDRARRNLLGLGPASKG